MKGFKQLVKHHQKQGKIVYFINFMFKALPGKRKTWKQIMVQEVIRFRDLLWRAIVRDRNDPLFAHLKPIVIGCPDFPVPKGKKTTNGVPFYNDGMHYNFLLLVPPPRKPHGRTSAWLGPVSRLKVSLTKHVEANQHIYLTDRLEAIDITRQTYGSMVDYAIKMLKRGRVSWDDDLLVL